MDTTNLNRPVSSKCSSQRNNSSNHKTPTTPGRSKCSKTASTHSSPSNLSNLSSQSNLLRSLAPTTHGPALAPSHPSARSQPAPTTPSPPTALPNLSPPSPALQRYQRCKNRQPPTTSTNDRTQSRISRITQPQPFPCQRPHLHPNNNHSNSRHPSIPTKRNSTRFCPPAKGKILSATSATCVFRHSTPRLAHSSTVRVEAAWVGWRRAGREIILSLRSSRCPHRRALRRLEAG